MDWVRRLDLIVLAFMLSYALTVVTRVFYRCQIIRDLQRADRAGRSKLSADLNVQAGRLKSIASVAPYLGLLGTVFGILDTPGIGSGIAMEKSAALARMSSGVAAALVTTAAGILVTVPTICFYNYLCSWKDLFQREVSGESQKGHPRITVRLPLAKRFSQLPGFGLIAAIGLAALVAVYTPHFDPLRPTGFGVDLASTRCEDDGHDRLIVLHVTNAGKIFLNTEKEDWRNLAGRLSEVYSTRAHRTLYLLADEGVSFQAVADVIDIVESTEGAARTEQPGITVRLITPAAMKGRCPHPGVARSSLHGSR